MILVTAATGQVGGEAARELVRAGARVRVLMRDPAAADGLAGAEIVAGTFDDDASLERALRGVDALMLAGRDSPESVVQHERVLAQATRAGVGHIVKLSAIGARAGSPIALMREHEQVDARIRAGSAAWTVLRPHLYMQNLLRATATLRATGTLTASLGDARIPLVDTRDVGAAAAAVLLAPGAHAGRTYALTGPEALGYGEVAAAIGRVAGRPVRYVAAAADDLEAELRASGVPGWRAFDLAHIAAAYAPGELAVAPDLPRLLGRPAGSLAAFLADHRNDFGGSNAGA
jgi:uncharacterized protein YbjT (DUF2867 family)